MACQKVMPCGAARVMIPRQLACARAVCQNEILLTAREDDERGAIAVCGNVWVGSARLRDRASVITRLMWEINPRTPSLRVNAPSAVLAGRFSGDHHSPVLGDHQGSVQVHGLNVRLPHTSDITHSIDFSPEQVSMPSRRVRLKSQLVSREAK